VTKKANKRDEQKKEEDHMSFKTPSELAHGACNVAVAKSRWSVVQMLILGILAGAYIGFAGFLYTVVTHDLIGFAGIGFTKFLGGAVFSVGLMLVVIAGAELFTGNCMMPMGILSGCVTTGQVLRNWFWVYLANFLGSVLIAFLIFHSGLAAGPVGAHALKIAAGKMSLPFKEALVRGILCNWLVVLAVWMSMAATDIVGKIFAIFFPIMAFVASGFEHSIANMYFMFLGILLKGSEKVVGLANISEGKLASVGWEGFFHNLIPVTIGNIIGGVFFVAILYFVVFKDKLQEK